MSDNQFTRLERIIGKAGLQRLQRASVVVVGLGAVGSYATEALARAGVGRLRLVDFDEVRPSNINRQLYALHSTVGQSKAQLAAARVRDINPRCDVEPMQVFVHADTMEHVLGGPPDLVIDAIDSFAPKCELLSAVLTRGLAVVSSMGAALRTDPTAIRIGPLAKTVNCPLARRLRKALRKRDLPLDLLCVHSVEPVDQLPPEAGVQGDAEPEVHPRGRLRRSLGSLPTLTGIFGLTVANTAMKILLGNWAAENGTTGGKMA